MTDVTPSTDAKAPQPRKQARRRLWKLGGFSLLALGLLAWGSGYYYLFRLPASVERTAQARKDPCVDQILTQRNGAGAQVPKRDILHAEQFCRHQANLESAGHSEWAPR